MESKVCFREETTSNFSHVRGRDERTVKFFSPSPVLIR